MSLLIGSNSDDVFLRNVILGVSYFFYDMIYVNQVIDGNVTKKNVPIFYALSGSSQFLNDIYSNKDLNCPDPSVFNGNYNSIPSGYFKLTSAEINSNDITNGFIKANFFMTEETEFSSQMKEMSARTLFLPMNMSIDVEIKCSSEIERMKVFQAIISKFYKIKKFWFRYLGFSRIPCTISFPESYGIEKNFQFTSDDADNRYKLTFSMELLSYMPIIDETTITPSGNRIKGNFTANVSISDKTNGGDECTNVDGVSEYKY
jgi:hypothetical protein